jgi:pimeloyl-ACP methyl ester carboxylesterase
VTGLPADAASHVVDLNGEIHYVEFGAASRPGAEPVGPPIVLVHGLGGSALNWSRVGPALAQRSRVYALDLPGFGLSAPLRRSGSVAANTDVLDAFIRHVAGGRAVVVGNSMGGLISMRQASLRPATVAGLALLDPVLPRPAGAALDRRVAAIFLAYMMPGVGTHYLRRRRNTMTPRAMVLETLTLCCVDPAAVPTDFVDPAVAQAEVRSVVRDGVTPRQLDVAFLQAARSVVRLGARREAYLAMMRNITAPVVLMHGTEDRLVPVAAARAAAAACPMWTYLEFENVGHVPMIEIPETVVEQVSKLHAAVADG